MSVLNEDPSFLKHELYEFSSFLIVISLIRTKVIGYRICRCFLRPCCFLVIICWLTVCDCVFSIGVTSTFTFVRSSNGLPINVMQSLPAIKHFSSLIRSPSLAGISFLIWITSPSCTKCWEPYMWTTAKLRCDCVRSIKFSTLSKNDFLLLDASARSSSWPECTRWFNCEQLVDSLATSFDLIKVDGLISCLKTYLVNIAFAIRSDDDLTMI